MPLEPNGAEPDPLLTPQEILNQRAQEFQDKAFEKWLQFSAHPDTTEKSASICCDLLLQSALDAILLCKPFIEQRMYSNILDTFTEKMRPLTTEYRRKQHLKSLGLYVEPMPYVIDYEHVNVRTEEGVHLIQRRETVAMPSIRESLLAVLSNNEIANELVMPTD
uniref:Uncharacterized protein n=1 Tax=Panagrolaimus superbus TaxID=310955 RepID=A0A914YHG5_9BILA